MVCRQRTVTETAAPGEGIGCVPSPPTVSQEILLVSFHDACCAVARSVLCPENRLEMFHFLLSFCSTGKYVSLYSQKVWIAKKSGFQKYLQRFLTSEWERMCFVAKPFSWHFVRVNFLQMFSPFQQPRQACLHGRATPFPLQWCWLPQTIQRCFWGRPVSSLCVQSGCRVEELALPTRADQLTARR